MSRVFENPAALLAAAGETLGPTDWLDIDQQRIDLFAEATGDHQWIHVDPERAKDGPFGATIAHGYLTLSLANLFLPQLMEVRGSTKLARRTSRGVTPGIPGLPISPLNSFGLFFA